MHLPPVDRRTVLKGLGVSLTLPWLESLATTPVVAAGPSGTQGAMRFVAMLFPLGVNTETWGAAGQGDELRFKPTLAPLEPIKHKVNVLADFCHPHLKELGKHAGKVAAYLTGEPGGRDLNRAGVSIDQLIAERIGEQTELPSLALGIAPARTGRGFYDSNISWRGPDKPVSKEIDPQATFEMLFGDHSWLDKDRSVLDFILGQAKQLDRRLSQRDSQTLAEYFDSIRELETRARRLQERSQNWHQDHGLDAAHGEKPVAGEPTVRFHPEDPAAAGEAFDFNGYPPEDFVEHTRLMLDLLVLALQADKTRVVSYMFDSYGPKYSDFSFIPGVRGQWHAISHHMNVADSLQQYHLINRWHVSQYAYLLQRMDAVQEGERTLLDNSMVMIASDMWCGNRHECPKYPLILSGAAGGRIRTGRHIDFEGGSMSRLFLSIAELMGAPLDGFGEADKPYGSELTG